MSCFFAHTSVKQRRINRCDFRGIRSFTSVSVWIVFSLIITGCSERKAEPALSDAERQQELDELAAIVVGDLEPLTIEWTDLLPAEDLEALSTPPDFVNDIEDGSEQDALASQLSNESIPPATTEAEKRYQQALVSQNVVPEMADQMIRLPGFVVPIAFNDQEWITEFFLVPFFGACIHIPAPPPNQIIYVKYPKGFRVEHLYDPIWVTGQLTISTVKNEIATSAYSLRMTAYEDYPYRG